MATPIGHLQDLSPRARAVLAEVALVLAEDTRRTRQLMQHCAIDNRIEAYHDHSSAAVRKRVIERLCAGQSMALVSDAGTPLVADPGHRLVVEAIAAGVRVVPVPGPSALIAALAASGLATEHFYFGGFLPSASGARRAALERASRLGCPAVFYEVPHRIAAALADLEVVVPELVLVLARELTKLHEQFYRGTATELRAQLHEDANMARGELVLVIAANREQSAAEIDADALLRALLHELPPAAAARVAARVLPQSRAELYRRILQFSSTSVS